jgi:Domain of Unknown Function (DUF326)
MNRRLTLSLGEVITALFMVLAACGSGRTDDTDNKHSGPMEQCARVCAACLRECESCSDHCARLLASGKKEHLATLQTCADCAEFCGAAAKIASRHGPMAVTICEACAKACDACGAACPKTPDDPHMQKCAKACRDCAKACRDMIKQVGSEPSK